jgi:hypothetical protein
MLKRVTARTALVLSLVVPSIAVLASPAMAFTKATDCTSSSVGSGQWIEFRADNGAFLGRVTWLWSWHGQASRYQLGIEDRTGDGAVLSARVDAGSQVIEYTNNRTIGYAVRKYKVVWNGYESNWFPPNYCDTSIRP